MEHLCCAVQNHLSSFEAFQRFIVLCMLQHTSIVLKVYIVALPYTDSLLCKPLHIDKNHQHISRIFIAYTQSSAGARKSFLLVSHAQCWSYSYSSSLLRLSVLPTGLPQHTSPLRSVLSCPSPDGCISAVLWSTWWIIPLQHTLLNHLMQTIVCQNVSSQYPCPFCYSKHQLPSPFQPVQHFTMIAYSVRPRNFHHSAVTPLLKRF